MSSIIVTGATGFIGAELLRQHLLTSEENTAHVLIKPRSGASSLERLEQLVREWQKFVTVPNNWRQRINVIDADLVTAKVPGALPPADYFFHAAASTNFDLSIKASRLANLVTTQRAILLAQQVPTLKRFVHFSTAFVNACADGMVDEARIPTKFNNAYEQSKYESEICVQHSGLPYLILRPSIVVGHSQTGYVRKFKVIYAVFRMWLTGLIPRAPLDAKASVDLVPIDYLVAAALRLASESKASNQTVHLCAGNGTASPVEIFKAALQAFDLPPGKTSPPWVADILASPPVRPFVGHGLGQVLDAFRWHLPYLGHRTRIFNTEKARSLLESCGITCPAVPSYAETLFRFCKVSNWGRQSVRSSPDVQY